MRTVQIDIDQLIYLSEGESIEIWCDICKTKEKYNPIFQIGKGTETDEGWEEYKGKWYHIMIPDVEDAYFVECSKCGNLVIARFYGLSESERQELDRI